MKITRKTFILLSISILTFGALIIFFLLPLNQEIKGTKKELVNQRYNLDFILKKGADPKDDFESMRLEEKRQRISSLFIKKEETLNLITTLENLAAKNNLEQKFDLPKNLNLKATGVQTFFLSFNLQGSYNDFLNYLNDLEKEEFYLNIESLTLSAGGSIMETNEIPTTSTVSVNFLAKSYWK